MLLPQQNKRFTQPFEYEGLKNNDSKRKFNRKI